MAKTSFKQFVFESTLQSKALGLVKHLLGTDDFETVDSIDDKELTNAKREAHKYLDSAAGPWVIEKFKTKAGKHFVRVIPPKGRDDKHMFFLAKEPAEVTESEIFEASRNLHNVIGKIFPSDQFTWNPSTKTFSAEASTLRDGHLKQLWNDSADVGFGIKSAKTGNTVLFTLHKPHKDRENEVTHWEYHVYNPQRDPKLNGVKVVVFND